MGKRFEGILICTDLDGTLLKHDKTVSRENMEAMTYFKENGGLFTFITGRGPVAATELCSRLQLNAPIGCFNGGGIYDHQKGKLLWMATLDTAAMEMLDAVDAGMPDIAIQVNTADEAYFCKCNKALEHFRAVSNLPDRPVRYRGIEEPIGKVIFAHHEDARIEALKTFLHSQPKADRFDFIRSERDLYEILPKNVSKGSVLLRMADMLGIDRKKTIAVGDYENDISMIRSAGVGYAAENACPAAKATADRTTVSNEEHAIAAIVADIESGELGF